MESETPAQLPVSQETVVQAPPVVSSTGTIMYQISPDQVQPLLVQVPAGQFETTPEGQPIQFYYVTTSQPVKQEKPEPVVSGHHVSRNAAGEPVQQQQLSGAVQFDLSIDHNFLKSPLCYIKIAEFVALLCAWACLLKYLDILQFPSMDGKAEFFKAVTILSWVVVLLYLILYIFSFPKFCKCKRPSLFTITSVCLFFILFSLLLACTGNLVPRASHFGAIYGLLTSENRQSVNALYAALAFGFLSCILFIVDLVLNYRKFQAQKEQESSPDQARDASTRRRVWDINYEYLRTSVFRIKFAEMALLFGAWVSNVEYLTLRREGKVPLYIEDPKAEFFVGITVFAWVMVILQDLTFIFSFDKICSRSSPWTLTVLISYVVLTILLIACCGTLTTRAVYYGDVYDSHSNQALKSNILALFIGLALGYISWIIFIVDIALTYRMYRQQVAREFFHQQLAQRPVIHLPCEVNMPLVTGPPQVYQPISHPGQQQQPSQNSGQIPEVTAGSYTS